MACGHGPRPGTVDNRSVSVEHYENFPVASWLCPPRLRPAIAAIYRFARTADDIADEGDTSPAERMALLDAYGLALRNAASGRDTSGRWHEVFAPLAAAIERHRLPLAPLADLLSAFAQDTANPLYADRAAVFDYCARSANPVGRLLLHLAGVRERGAQAESDSICTALQLVNFWQDLSIDLPRGRIYVPAADAARFGLDPRQLKAGADNDASRALVRSLVAWARETMLAGAPLVHRLPGRLGWELRFVVQGGLRVLEHIAAGGHNALSHRPTIGKADMSRLVWRALRMRPMTPPIAGRLLPNDEHR
ncbi:MAG TPA: squalene synthase HpnC [Burkholderiaceae bacterium]